MKRITAAIAGTLCLSLLPVTAKAHKGRALRLTSRTGILIALITLSITAVAHGQTCGTPPSGLVHWWAG